MPNRRAGDSHRWDTVGLRIAILALLPIAAVAAASVVVFTSQTRPAVVTEFQAELQEALQLKSYATDMWVTQQISLINWIGGSAAARSLEPDALAEQSETFRRQFSQVRALVYVDATGEVVLDSAGRSGGYVGDRQYFREAMQGTTGVTVLRGGRTAAEAFLIVAAPITSVDEAPAGVVFGALRADVLEAVMAGGVPGTDMIVQMADQTGQIIATLSPDTGELASDPALLASADRTDPGRDVEPTPDGAPVVFTDGDGVAQVLAVRRVPATGWTIAAQAPIRSITHVVRSYNRSLLITVGVMIAMVAVVTIIVVYTLERPLSRLDRISRQISDGNYTAAAMLPAPGNAPVELRRLYGTVQDMALLVGTRQRALEHASLTDPLTGIANRRRLEAEGEAIIRSCCIAGHSYALFMADIDRFKHVNDTHGHSAGDAILREVAALMRAELRTGDLLARYGGEEFAAILPEISGIHARAIAERVRVAIEEHRFETEAGSISITISIGVADATKTGCAEPEGSALAVSLGAADTQLYAAKQNGRNRVCMNVDSSADQAAF